MRKLWFISLTCCLLIAADDPDTAVPAKSDLDLMQGLWTRVSTESRGNKRLEKEPRLLLRVTGNEFTFGFNRSGRPSDPELVALDPKRTLKAIDLTPTAGPPKGKPYFEIGRAHV